jgi:hypothetical protein
VWLAEPGNAAQEQQIATAMRAARAAEYHQVIAEAAAAADEPDADRVRTVRRLRAELRRISRRDFFPPRERDTARSAVQALADSTTVTAEPKLA